MRNEKYLGEDCYFEAWSQYDRLGAQLLSHGVQDRFCESVSILDFVPVWRSSGPLAGTWGHSAGPGQKFVNNVKTIYANFLDRITIKWKIIILL